MKTHELTQGSPAWHAHRATHFNASDAPAMMGVSIYKTRTQLLHELHTGYAPDVDAATQRRFDDGHRFEALARPLAEEFIGQSLYPVTGSEGKFSASFDGLTMGEDIAFEHKTLNDELRAVMNDDCLGHVLPGQYQIQMEQQLMVSGADRVLFMASKWNGDELIEERHCWYTANPTLRAEIVAGWAQFDADLAAYVPAEVLPATVAAAVTALPAVSVQVTGSIAVRDNFSAFETALRDFIDNRLIREPKTDQDFADLDLQIKALKNAEAALDAAEAQMLAQVDTVDAAKRMKDMLKKLTTDNRLMAEKLLAAKKEQIRGEIVADGIAALREHIAGLNTRLGKPYMPTVAADFAGAIKNKRTVDSLRESVNNELTRAKIESSAIADKIQINLTTLRELASEQAFLFADTAQIVLKAPDDLTMLVKSRIADHKAIEEKRIADDRERIRQEELDRIAVEAAKPAETAEPVVAPTSTPVAAANVVPMRTSPRPAAPSTPPTLKLGQISDRLGFALTGDFLKNLGFEPAATDKSSKLFHEADFPLICMRLVSHIQNVQAKQAA